MDETRSNLPVPVRTAVRAPDAVLGAEDQAALAKAVRALEHTNIAARIATTVGKRLGSFARFLPPGVSGIVNKAAENAISAALHVAIRSLANKKGGDSRRLHRAVAALSGAAGGIFGMSSLPVELPVSTVIILRSIADIARSEGENLDDPEAVMACLQVFALGAHDEDEGFVDSGYYASRAILAKTVSEASRYVLSHGLADEAAPALVRLVAQIGSRFGIVVSEKLAAQALPLVGAAGGAAVNYAFAEHFQSLASGHFVVRRLERQYGNDLVRAEYNRLLGAQRSAA